MLYAWIKVLHVVSASVLFGTGIGSAFYMLYANIQKDIKLIAKATNEVVFADWIFTTSSGIIQAFTGFILIALKGYSLLSPWVVGSIIGYVIAGICWLPVVWLQIHCRDLATKAWINNEPLPPEYKKYFSIWVLLGIPAFLALIGVFYLMTNKPMHFP